MLHRLMLNNTVHIGFGQKWYKMDTPGIVKDFNKVKQSVSPLLRLCLCNQSLIFLIKNTVDFKNHLLKLTARF